MMGTNGEYVVEDVVSIIGGDLRARIIIPPRHIVMGDDSCNYIHVSTVPNFSAALFGGQRVNTDGVYQRRLANTDIIQRLIELRDAAIDGELEKILGAATETLSVFAGASRKPKTKDRMLLPSATTITTPTICGVDGVVMKVLIKNKRAPLFMELTSDNIAYVREVCKAQMKGGGIKRCRTPLNASGLRRNRYRTSKVVSESPVTPMQDCAFESPIDDHMREDSFSQSPPIIATPEPAVGVKPKLVSSSIKQFFKPVVKSA